MSYGCNKSVIEERKVIVPITTPAIPTTIAKRRNFFCEANKVLIEFFILSVTSSCNVEY